MVFSVQNDFTPADSQLGHLDRVLDPGSFTFTFYPDLIGTIDKIGREGSVGPASDYWISGLSGRDASAGKLASVVASSAAIPDAAHSASETYGTYPNPEPTPAATDVQTWKTGATPAAAQKVTLGLTDVSTATLDTAGAGLRCGSVIVTSDGPTALRLSHLKGGEPVRVGGALHHAGAAGSATVTLPKGTTTISMCPGSPRRKKPAGKRKPAVKHHRPSRTTGKRPPSKPHSRQDSDGDSDGD
jgi:hypothetical protein